MTRLFPLAAAVALLLILAACAENTSRTEPQDPTPTASDSESAEATETPEATDSPEPTEAPTPSVIGGEGGFEFESNAEADELFLDRFTCQNLDDGYEVDFPSEWNANAEFGDVPPCSWFAAEEYTADGAGDVPDEVAIEIFMIDGERTYDDGAETEDRQDGFVGVTQSAYRVTVTDGDETAYEYVIQLGASPEEGPNLVARTSTEMGGDFDLNRAVLDRMVATMEFIGTIQ